MYIILVLGVVVTAVCATPTDLSVRQAAGCVGPGAKCAGARNYPLVPYRPCCDRTLVCAEREDPPEGTWGRFCISTDDAATNSSSAPQETSTPNATSGAGESARETTAPNATGTTLPNATETILPNGTRASVSPSPSSDNGSVCFPSIAVVELEDGSRTSMDQLSIGDSVKVGPNMFSKVFMFTHKMQGEVYDFLQITTATGAAITLTGGHYIPVDDRLVSASSIVIGSNIMLGNGNLDQVADIKRVRGIGLYNPQTLHGNIVVDGVVASTYTTAVEPRLAHAILAPFRSLSLNWGVSVSVFENGGGLLAWLVPRGSIKL